ncbi:YxeA family protein [Paenibacillus daejeonensis]|uniref:YxeA family protein n=1 Tax=Paenibacillus daejeonensis TaxID=135193 RepID=UPI0003613C9F|nr:YxeA family protein [Paenibacillus daejeonensis]
MKKVIILVAVFGLVIVAAAGFYAAFKEDFDRFNPLYEEEYVYVMINEPAKEDENRYHYQLTGYNEVGKQRKVRFSASVDLEQGTYLKLLAKGSYTKSWESITEEQLPSGVSW